jgi:hypothetical protein
VGPADYLAEFFGLTVAHILAEAEKTIARK